MVLPTTLIYGYYIFYVCGLVVWSGCGGIVFVGSVYTPSREAKREGGELGRIMALGSHDRLIILD